MRLKASGCFRDPPAAQILARCDGRHDRIRCPAHEGKDYNCAVWDTPDGVKFKCYSQNCSPLEIRAALRSRGILPSYSPSLPPKRREYEIDSVRRQPEATERRAEHPGALLQATTLVCESVPAKAYLQRSRGLRDPNRPDDLRAHARLKHVPTGTYWPALIAAIRDIDGRLLAIHRTFLKPDGSGKAPVEPNKMMLGNLGDGSVHLGDAGKTLIIGEGIETCLSVQQETGIPARAALSAGRLDRIAVPDHVEEIIILADNDRNGVGQDAAQRAARRWLDQGRRCSIYMPNRPGADFNDVLREGGRLDLLARKLETPK